MVSDGNGGAVVAWTDASLGLRRVDTSGTVVWAYDGPESNVFLQDLLPDRQGGAWLAVIETPVNTDLLRWRRVTASGQLLGNDEGTPITWQGFPIARFVSPGDDGVLLVWTTIWNDFGEYFNADIRARRIGLDGQAVWESDAILLSRGWMRGQASAVSDGAGGAIATWSSLPGDGDMDPFAWPSDPPVTSDVRAQRITRAGQLKWGQEGVVVCGAPGDQSPSVAATDSRGGAIVCWPDHRPGTVYFGTPSLYASALSLSGNLRSTSSPLSVLSPRQKIRIEAEGGGHQELVYNYTTSEMSVTPYSEEDGHADILMEPGEWVGVFHYDYASGRFNQVTYSTWDPFGV